MNIKENNKIILKSIIIEIAFFGLNFTNSFDKNGITITMVAIIEYTYPNWFSAIPKFTKNGCQPLSPIIINCINNPARTMEKTTLCEIVNLKPFLLLRAISFMDSTNFNFLGL